MKYVLVSLLCLASFVLQCSVGTTTDIVVLGVVTVVAIWATVVHGQASYAAWCKIHNMDCKGSRNGR